MAYKVVLLPGDGIGPEVIREARRALERIGGTFQRDFTFSEHLIGGAALKANRPPLPASTLEAAMASDAVLLGAVGDPAFDHLPPGSRPESALLALRKSLGVFANLRPARAWNGLEDNSPLKKETLAGTDMIVVRELLGGLYYGEPREWNRATDQAINTLRYARPEVERVARVAFDLARLRGKRVVSVDKANVLETSQLWRAVVNDVAKSYPDVQLTHEYVDACAMKLACAPASFDVVLTENLFGDILSDEAGAICGSLGMLPSASLGAGPGLFEPVHGSAPTIAGKNIANPCGALLSAAMMLRSGLKLDAEATALERAVEAALASGLRTADLGGTTSTSEFGGAVVRAI
ncbi:MAG: 3-isopropylmalate dehydrogenase [Acidobacteria bacterium]|nr:MAG: 3-isopropylmalate dehydrogenase [Acidobacteriota bacterium]